MKVLLTGFEPFGGEKINPSWLSVKALPDSLETIEIKKLLLPVAFKRAADIAIREAEAYGADAVLSIGQAKGRSSVTPEMVGINLRYASLPDNDGNAPLDEPIVLHGPNAYSATANARKMASAIQAAGIPGQVSLSAGAYVCNDLFFSLLHHFDKTCVKVGFIHVPLIPKQGEPSLPLPDLITALKAAVLAI